PTLIAAKEAEINRLEGKYRMLLANAGADLIEGYGSVTGPHHVSVGDKTYTAGKILLAVGGVPQLLDVPGMTEHAITSNEALDLPDRPQHIVIYGSGYIALEFAGIFAGFGSDVHLVYRGELPLRGFDEDVRSMIAPALEGRGITLHSGRTIATIEAHDSQYQVTFDDGNTLLTDKVMAATGRRPNITGLGLEEAGVSINGKGAVIVDDRSCTSVPSIFAVGDVTDRINLTPVAIGEGHAFADSEFGGMPRTISHENIASAVFSQPPIASVGLSEVEAEKQYGGLTIYESRFRPMKNTLSGRQEQTYMKLVVSSDTDKIIGVHMMGPDAAEIMQGVAIAVKMGATKADFDAVIGIHPSAAEEFVTMRTPRTS
ncbi:MAG: FAD-dependent oxidoreductase, partial [Alphaproteobacteria bacterium]|nr:FAD-dependent oxidoreductase [Alphaproteobacteria bacterium]